MGAKNERKGIYMKNIKQDLEQKKIKRAYLIFGEERFLVRSAKNMMVKALVKDGDNMNYAKYSGKDCNASKIIDLAETMPFFADIRVILIEDSGWFKESSEDMAEYIKQIPDSTCLIFVESEVDKRNKLYKQLKASGYICECKRASDKELSDWIVRYLAKAGRKITGNDMKYLLEKLGDDMDNISSELEKLIDYTYGRDIVTCQDIDAVCISEITGKIFEMIDAIGEKKQQRALELYYDLIATREAPMKILFMLARQFNIMLQIKEMSERHIAATEMASKLGMQSFIVNKTLSQCRNFKYKTIKAALKYCIGMEEAVKQGNMNDKMAVELIIIRYSAGEN